MINFACKPISEEDIVRCSFGINKTEYYVLMYLLKKNVKDLTVNEIAKGVLLERSGVQKALKGLLEKGLVTRKMKNLENGGYVYIYSTNKKEVKEKIKSVLKKWVKDAIKSVEEL